MPNDTVAAPNTPKNVARIPDEKTLAVAPAPPLVSIVIPCCGMLEYTQLCVPSILKHTRMPYELIFLDIGSLDGTADFLAGLAIGLQQVRIEVVRTQTDLGIPLACRDALERCRGEFVVLLNNDTIVTRGWVNRFIGLLSMSPATGIVGPMTNYGSMPQWVETDRSTCANATAHVARRPSGRQAPAPPPQCHKTG